MSTILSTHQAEGGVTVVVLDAPGAKVNTLSTALGEELSALFEQLAVDEGCSGVVLISGKPDSFVAGADIEQLSQLKTAEEATALSRHGQGMLDRLAEMPKPVVAAIHGPCLGGGLELALACHGRVCSEHRATKLAVPEVQLGLIPGAGGTQRLPRLVGAQVALDMILTGKNIAARKALKIGLVDEVVPQQVLEQAAVKRALALVEEWDARGGERSLKTELKELRRWLDETDPAELLLAGNPLGRMVMFKKAGEMVQSKTRGNYPALPAAIRAVEAGLSEGMKHGLAVEAEEFGELVVSSVSRRLVELYWALQSIKKDPGVGETAITAQKVERLAVLGGGLMGSGIAYVTSARGATVRIKERDHDAAAAALGAVWELVEGAMKRRRISRAEAQQQMARVTAGPELRGLRRADLVIEAVFEDLELKQRLLGEVEGLVDEGCIVASNTSSIPIKRIAAALSRPQNVLGMHFFSPVHKMPLLEVIRTEQTEDRAVVTAVALGKKLGKQVIVVRDGVGFYTSRILAPYLNEAAHVLVEGAAVDAVDRAMVDFGYPVGPFTLMDEVGIDVGEKVARIMFEAYGERMTPPQGLEALARDGRKGRKNKRGFYRYDQPKKKGKKRPVDESIYALLPEGAGRAEIEVDQVQLRVTLQMVNEALHCLGEGILRNARDGNVGAIFGLGFPPFLGGPLRYVDVRGAQAVLDDMHRLRDQHGARFEPAPLLVEAAADGRRLCEE